jgi:hypothetical protein
MEKKKRKKNNIQQGYKDKIEEGEGGGNSEKGEIGR